MNTTPRTARSRPSRNGFARIKRSLRHKLTTEFEGTLPSALIRRALDEAEQLSVSTGFPQLFFPELAHEQVRRIALFATPPAPSSRQFALHPAA